MQSNLLYIIVLIEFFFLCPMKYDILLDKLVEVDGPTASLPSSCTLWNYFLNSVGYFVHL